MAGPVPLRGSRHLVRVPELWTLATYVQAEHMEELLPRVRGAKHRTDSSKVVSSARNAVASSPTTTRYGYGRHTIRFVVPFVIFEAATQKDLPKGVFYFLIIVALVVTFASPDGIPLRSMSKQKVWTMKSTSPNNSLQPTPVGRSSSAFAVDIAAPAWLSSGR